MNANVLLTFALTLGTTLALPAAVSAVEGPQDAHATEYQFGVYYGDRRIGNHRYEIVQRDGTLEVSSSVNLTYKLLFVTLYDYTHQASELWRGRCLTAMSSTTDDNGEGFTVQVSRDEPGPTLTATQTAPDVLDGDCPATFAYWDVTRLDRPALINTQTGVATPTTLTREGTERRDGQVAVRYRLDAEGLAPIYLWYTENGRRWLGLETRRDGAILQYRLENTGSSQSA